MLVYNRKGKIGITFKDDIPTLFPEYIIEVDKDNEVVYVNGQTITPISIDVLDSDIMNDTAVDVSTSMAVNLNGHTISIPDDTEGNGVFHVMKGGYLSIEGKGTINGVGNNDYNIVIWSDGGRVVIEDGTFTNIGAKGKDDSHFDLIYAKNGGIVEINGGYFECETPKWTLNNNDSNPGTIIVKGGTFHKYDPSHSETEPGSTFTNFVAPGYKVVRNGDDYIVVKD